MRRARSARAASRPGCRRGPRRRSVRGAARQTGPYPAARASSTPIRGGHRDATAVSARRAPGSTAAVAGTHCPHCTLPLGRDPAPGEAIRCPSCGLLVGPGRALRGSPPRRRTGAAAGSRAARARRAEGAERRELRTASELLAAIAAAQAARRDRRELTMLQYEQLCREDDSLPELSALLAAFGTWKELGRRLRDARPSAPRKPAGGARDRSS